MVKLARYDDPGTARFVTFSCYHNYNLLISEFALDTFVKCLESTKQKYSFRLLGYVLMPNHVHVVIVPPNNVRLSRIISEIKSLSGRTILQNWRAKNYKILSRLLQSRDGQVRHAFWQRRYYDHNCRTTEKAIEKIKYCHKNPVRAGLVEKPEDWKWSSYRFYYGMDNVVLQIDRIAL